PASMTQRWVDSTPASFTFSMKLPQELTHKPTDEPVPAIVDRFLSGVAPIRRAGRLGPLVAQFPPSFRKEKGWARFESILQAIRPEYRLAVELRHASWFVPETLARLQERGAALVWSVVPGARAPTVITGDFVYVRFVGDRALTQFDHLQRDGRAEMEAMRDRLRREGMTEREIFVLLNNHYMGFAPGTVRELQDVFGLPLADLGAARRDRGQATLGSFDRPST
ncbi:MAG: DUF72 domain-containing protein, partial [Thermoplasmata archaeon]|nr:DUF72 domain-containing protein [Thermoplasmata archaeon]